MKLKSDFIIRFQESKLREEGGTRQTSQTDARPRPGPETPEDKNTIEKGQGRGSVPTGMNASLSESP